MKLQMVGMLCLLGLAAGAGVAQEVVPLYSGEQAASAQGNYPEKEYFSSPP